MPKPKPRTPLDRSLVTAPTITGVEVTQAIQFYGASQHLTDSQDQGGDNSLAIVAGKPAYVRVYISGGLIGRDRWFSGRVTIERKETVNVVTSEMKWKPVGVFDPNVPIKLGMAPDYIDQRSVPANTLNFVLPADVVYGILRLFVEIWAVPSRQILLKVVDTWELEVSAIYAQTLRVRGIPIRYDGPGAGGVGMLNLAAPTVEDLRRTCDIAHRMFPVGAEGSYSLAGELSFGTSLEGAMQEAGGCASGWSDLLDDLAEARDNDGNRDDVSYVGILPATTPRGAPGGGGNDGCAREGIAAVPAGRDFTMAHELAHTAGLLHTGCGNPNEGQLDDTYPVYDPYLQGSIGEFGLDITTGGPHHPAAERDIMSYCGPRWISVHTHRKLIPNAKFAPYYVGPAVPNKGPGRGKIPHAPWTDPIPRQRLISIIGRTSLTGDVTVRSVRRVEANGASRGGVPTPLVAQLLGSDEAVLAEARVVAFPVHGCGCGCSTKGAAMSPFGQSFQCFIPNVAVGSAIRIVLADATQPGTQRILWRREAPARAPKLGSVGVRSQGKQLILDWKVSAAAATELRFSVQYSTDRGRTWDGLATGLKRPGLRVPLNMLRGGDAVALRVLAHDGFHTSRADSRMVRIAPQPPKVVMLYPQADVEHRKDTPLRLQAAALTCETVPESELEVQWTLDGKRVGNSLDCWVLAPESGTHTCRVTIRHRLGVSRATTRFKIAAG